MIITKCSVNQINWMKIEKLANQSIEMMKNRQNLEKVCESNK